MSYKLNINFAYKSGKATFAGSARRQTIQLQTMISKNMKTLKTFLVVAFLCCTAFAQAQTSTITGILADSLTQEREPYATIRVFKDGKTDKPVGMSLADIDGNISQTVSGTGTFTLVISSMGKETVTKKVNLNGEPTLHLGTIYLHDDKQMLKEVEVVGHKPLVKMETDKMSYNVENDADAKASTVLDMLRKVPMVTVDGQDNISVNGSNSFKVYVDGKPNMMLSQNPSMAFKNMPASMVKNIEVITNPGARYDAEGTSGILNIVMNRQQAGMQSMDGINGDVSFMGGNSIIGGSASVSGQKGKWSFSANGAYNYASADGTEITIEREQFSNAGNSKMHYFQDGRYIRPFAMGGATVGYELDSMSSVNASFNYMRWENTTKGNPTTNISGDLYGGDFSYTNRMKSVDTGTSWSGSIDYQRFFNPERTRSLTLAYHLSYSPQESNNETVFDKTYALPIDLTSRLSYNKSSATDHTAMIDYATPIGKGQTFNTGVKFIGRRSKADASYYLDNGGTMVLSPELSLKYRFDDFIAAAYTEYALNTNKWGAKAGLRYEQTWQKAKYETVNGKDFKKNYGNLIPSATLSYNIAPTTNIGLNYNMRISRPGISFLNPYVDRSTPLALTYGNTNLEVEKTHNTSLVFNHYANGMMINTTLSYSFCNNAIENYSFYADGLLHTTYGNIVKQRNMDLNVYINWPVTRSTRLMINESLSYIDTRSSALDARNNGWNISSMIGLQQTLPWNINLGAYLINRSKNYTLQGWSSGFNMIHGSITKKLLNDKLSIGVSGVSGLGNGGNLAIDVYSKGKDFVNKQIVRVPVKFIMATVTYSFGNSKIQQKSRQTKPDNDFKENNKSDGMIPGIGVGQ